MGLFDFVKEAGANLFGREQPKSTAARQDQDRSQEIMRAREQALENRKKAEALDRLVRDMGLQVEELRVEFSDGVATLEGKTSSQAEREKIILMVGNTQGVGQVDDRLVVEKPEPEAVMYTVRRGDTLSKIAKEHYGDARKYPVIFEANRPMLENPDKIYPGQVLRIPPLEP